MSAPVLTKEARERLESVVNGTLWLTRSEWRDDARAALAYIDALRAELDAENTRLIDALSELRGVREFTIPALEARVAVLAAECRAWRSAVSNTVLEPNTRWLKSAERAALVDARAATDAAGALEGWGK